MAGEGSAEVCDRVFSLKRAFSEAKSVKEMSGYTVAYGLIHDPASSEIIDEVLVTRFCAPHSYTGEDSVEISCHGGVTVRQEILRVLLENGARMAEPGEFTRRAFMAGKIDLSQAEAVMDVIASDSELALRAAESQLQGTLRSQIRKISEELYVTFAALEMLIDEPDDEDAAAMFSSNADALAAVREKMQSLINTYRQGRILSERMSVVICGIPNSGKSSLLNCLSGYDRAIVTNVPGTTRDTLEVVTSMGGVPVRLIDTAGIRRTEDPVEAIGVSRAEDALWEADIVLWLVSSEEDYEQNIEMLTTVMNLPSETKVGLLISKSDCTSKEACEALHEKILSDMKEKECKRSADYYEVISSVSREGIEGIEKFVRETYESLGTDHARGVMLTNQRHYALLTSAAEKLDRCIGLLRSGSSPEEPSLILRTAMEDLGEITGDSVSDALVQTIFSRFCVGK